MLDEPDALRRAALRDVRGPRLHRAFRLAVIEERIAHDPLDGGAAGGGQEAAGGDSEPVVYQGFTIRADCWRIISWSGWVRPLAVLDILKVDLAVVLGQTRMPIHMLLRMGRGAVIELDSTDSDMVEILANNHPIARGQIVVTGNRISVEVTELIRKAEVVQEPASASATAAPACSAPCRTPSRRECSPDPYRALASPGGDCIRSLASDGFTPRPAGSGENKHSAAMAELVDRASLRC